MHYKIAHVSTKEDLKSYIDKLMKQEHINYADACIEIVAFLEQGERRNLSAEQIVSFLGEIISEAKEMSSGDRADLLINMNPYLPPSLYAKLLQSIKDDDAIERLISERDVFRSSICTMTPQDIYTVLDRAPNIISKYDLSYLGIKPSQILQRITDNPNLDMRLKISLLESHKHTIAKLPKEEIIALVEKTPAIILPLLDMFKYDCALQKKIFQVVTSIDDTRFSSANDKIIILGTLLQFSLERITLENDEEKNFMLEVLSKFAAQLNASSIESSAKKNAFELFEQITQKVRKYFDPQLQEYDRIETGVYQKQYYDFTYNHSWSHKQKKGETFAHKVELVTTLVEVDKEKLLNAHRSYGFRQAAYQYASFKVYPVMDKPGLRCTAALPANLKSGPIDLQWNFFGTIDWASTAADVDSGAPGQNILKQHEQELLKNLNDMIANLSKSYPGRPINLRINGHSLGGSLSKTFTHSIQRALSVQNQDPEEIIHSIAKNLEQKDQAQKKKQERDEDSSWVNIDDPIYTHPETEKDLHSLKKRLAEDKAKFSGLTHLQKLNHVTLYALGSPGVSKKTDTHATLLTYADQPLPLSVYNHFHEEDLITKFGECEFLSGKKITPNIEINKNVKMKVEITQKEINRSFTLPFPGCDKKVLAAHNKMIADHNASDAQNLVQTSFSDVHHPMSPTHEKFQFNPIRVFLVTSLIKLVAAIVSLFTASSKNINPLEHLESSQPNALSKVGKQEPDTKVLMERFKIIVQQGQLAKNEECNYVGGIRLTGN